MANILVCDDAPDLRLLMQLTLEAGGHRVRCADGGVEALEMLDSLTDVAPGSANHIDAMVLDVQMPEVDGWYVLQAVRAHPVHSGLRVLMCTVKLSHEDLVRAWSLGTDGYLNKPFDLRGFTGALEVILQREDAARAQHRQEELRILQAADSIIL